MTALDRCPGSDRAGRAAAKRREESRTSSSSATPSAARRRCTRCCAAIPRSSCRMLKEPRFFAELRRMRPRFRSRAAPARCRRRSSSTWRCSPPREPEQRVGEASPSYLRSRTAAGAIAEVQPDARIIAILREPASFLRSLHLQLVQTHVETEKDLRKALALEERRRAGRQSPARSARPTDLLYSDHVRYVEQLRRYHARVRARAGAGADLRRLPLRQRGDGAHGAALPRGGRHAPRSRRCEANPSVRVRSRRLDELVHSVSVGAARLARGQGGPQGVTPRRLRREALRVIRRRVVSRAAARPRTRASDARAAPPLQG